MINEYGFPERLGEKEPAVYATNPLPEEKVVAVGAVTEGDTPHLSFRGDVVEGRAQTEPSRIEALAV